jgi:hypothetical protein
MAFNSSRFRLSTNELFSPSTPTLSLLSTPVLASYNFTTTPYALNAHSQSQTVTPCPKIRNSKCKNDLENRPLSDVLPSLNSEDSEPKRKKKKTYRPRRSTADRLVLIFDAIQDVKWTLGDFLYHTFQTKDKSGLDIKRTTQHAMYTTNFLQGKTSYSFRNDSRVLVT